MPPNEELTAFAAHGTTMALFLSVRRPRELQADLLAGGYAEDTPCAVVYRASWPDEIVIRCPLAELGERVRAAKITTQALVLVGPALGEEAGRSHVYDAGYGHRFRPLGRPDRYRTRSGAGGGGEAARGGAGGRGAVAVARRRGRRGRGAARAAGARRAGRRRWARRGRRGARRRGVAAPRLGRGGRERADRRARGVGWAVPPGTEALLADADVVAGGRAVLDALAPATARRVVLGKGLAATVAALRAEPGRVCVLASGDPGFFGIVRALGDVPLEVHPAPSSVALAFARLGIPWDDALVVSAHARDPRPAIHTALRHPKVAILTDDNAGSDRRGARRSQGDRGGTRSGRPDERIGSEPPFAQPNVVIVEGDERAPRATRWALPEDAFEHRAGMITKAEVRAVALAALGPGTGDLVWDVGCGSGSVAIECARLGAAVIAIDDDPDAIALTTRNAATHDVPVRTVTGTAPAALAGLPEPDATFVGGGGAHLPAILDHVAPITRRAVVVTVALIDRIAPAMDALAAHGLDVTATTLQANRLRPLAGGHRLAAENPVTVITGRRA